MEEITEEPAELVARVAALDIGKATLTACVRVPHDRQAGGAPAGGAHVRHADPGAAGAAGLADCQGVTLW